eukprot:834022_1
MMKLLTIVTLLVLISGVQCHRRRRKCRREIRRYVMKNKEEICGPSLGSCSNPIFPWADSVLSYGVLQSGEPNCFNFSLLTDPAANITVNLLVSEYGGFDSVPCADYPDVQYYKSESECLQPIATESLKACNDTDLEYPFTVVRIDEGALEGGGLIGCCGENVTIGGIPVDVLGFNVFIDEYNP